MRFYNHIDLHELGEYEELADQLSEENSSPKYHCTLEQVSISSYHIHVDCPLFINPIFIREFKKVYRVGNVWARTPYQLVIHLNQPSHFVSEVKRDLHFTFDEIMDLMLSKREIQTSVVTLNLPISKAS